MPVVQECDLKDGAEFIKTSPVSLGTLSMFLVSVTTYPADERTVVHDVSKQTANARIWIRMTTRPGVVFAFI